MSEWLQGEMQAVMGDAIYSQVTGGLGGGRPQIRHLPTPRPATKLTRSTGLSRTLKMETIRADCFEEDRASLDHGALSATSELPPIGARTLKLRCWRLTSGSGPGPRVVVTTRAPDERSGVWLT